MDQGLLLKDAAIKFIHWKFVKRSTRSLETGLAALCAKYRVQVAMDGYSNWFYALMMSSVPTRLIFDGLWDFSAASKVAITEAFDIHFLKFLDFRAASLNEPNLPRTTTCGIPIPFASTIPPEEEETTSGIPIPLASTIPQVVTNSEAYTGLSASFRQPLPYVNYVDPMESENCIGNAKKRMNDDEIIQGSGDEGRSQTNASVLSELNSAGKQRPVRLRKKPNEDTKAVQGNICLL